MSKARFERYLVLAQRFGARTQMFQEAAARRLGLTATELVCFRLVQLHGPLTASDLVRETGLRGASLSVVVDRLVGEGFLNREQDQSDRRRWLLRVEPSAVARLQPVYAAHARRVDALLDEYDDAGFETVLRFLDRFAEELRLTAVRLNDGEDAGDRPER